ncbi:MAG TPA: DUF4143 domain-containing protein [bacterium]|nr:DUF4143 domain-containing protein [bacterium]
MWGPRKTGKTTLLKQAFPQTVFYDLLETDTNLRLSKEPFRLREELSALPPSHFRRGPVIIDEIQKIPTLLDEVHWLIENKKLSFVLCGSSARKLKRAHANMLGGRAWRFELFPLTWKELGDRFDLIKALNQGLIPAHYLSDYPDRDLKAYVYDYLKEEIQYEGLVRNLPAFSRFLDAASFSQGELVNYSNISRDCGVDSKTVAGYYQILVDTLVGYLLEPFRKKRNRQIISETPKFYLFDVGVSGFLTKRTLTATQGPEFGRAFEHFVLMELLAYRSYAERDVSITFWRTKDGAEVDFVLDDGSIAIEVKGASRVDGQDLKGLRIFGEEHKPKRALLVCQEARSRKLESGITVLPWHVFLEQLWSGEVF